MCCEHWNNMVVRDINLFIVNGTFSGTTDL
jgi:hypothetical protein